MERIEKYDKALDYYRRTFKRRILDGNYPHEMVDYLKPYVKPGDTVADIGAGPIPLIGNLLEGEKIRVVASDLFAKEYATMWEGERPVIPVEYQNMENLTYKDNTFDVVHCSNALDHTDDAEKAASEMERVCKPGGWIILRHAPDQRSRFGGHHFWDIQEWKGMTRLSRPKTTFVIKHLTMKNDEFITTTWQKN